MILIPALRIYFRSLGLSGRQTAVEVGAAGRGGQLLGAPAGCSRPYFLPAESGFRWIPAPRSICTAGPAHRRPRCRDPLVPRIPYPRTPGRQQAAAAAAHRPASSTRRAASVNAASPPARPPGSTRPHHPGLRAGSSTLWEGTGVSPPLPGRGRLPDLPSLSSGPRVLKGQMPSLLRPGPRTESP